MNQPGNNIQLTCASCGQPYLIQAVYQNSPHQCPLCGAMAGGLPMQQPGLPLQQPGLPLQQQGADATGMQSPASYPSYQNPAPPGSQGATNKSTRNTVIFVVRCVVGVIAVVAIIWTLIYILNRDSSNITVNLGDAGEMGGGGALNAGTYDVKPGKTFKAKFKIKNVTTQDFYFKMRHSYVDGATISEEGQFVWEVPEDLHLEKVDFNFAIHDRNEHIFVEVVKIAFNVK